MSKKESKPTIALEGTLVSIGHNENLNCSIIRVSIPWVIKEPGFIITIPINQAMAKGMAPHLYERVTVLVKVK